VIVPASEIHAQDLEPRAFANAPVGLNFLVGAYAYSTGGVSTDPSLPIEDAELDLHTDRDLTAAFAYWLRRARGANRDNGDRKYETLFPQFTRRGGLPPVKKSAPPEAVRKDGTKVL
jgi:hypothetical protein